MTTGEVARILGVTPDTVLKWVKSGKARATRTAGGHFRISPTECRRLEGERSSSPSPAPFLSSLHCWEFFSRDDSPTDHCRDCLVFRARAKRCYEMSELGKDGGHCGTFQLEGCTQCAFFRACKGLPPTVLVVTRNAALARKLSEKVPEKTALLRFAATGYETSTAIEKHRPILIIMDGTHPEVRSGHLTQSILNDERLPGVRIHMVLGKNDARPDHPVSVLPHPLRPRMITELVNTLTQPTLRQDSAPA